MKNLFKCLLITSTVAFAGGINAKPAQAIDFNFSWNSTGSTPNPAGNFSTVTGTFTINRLPGETFTAGDFTNIDLILTTIGPNAGVNNLSLSVFNAGSISADGNTATFTDMGFNFFGPTDQFSCSFPGCIDGVVLTGTPGGTVSYTFPLQADALASFQATRVPFEFEASLGLLALGGMFGGYTLTKEKKDKKLNA